MIEYKYVNSFKSRQSQKKSPKSIVRLWAIILE
jgi:hypothetical protein